MKIVIVNASNIGLGLATPWIGHGHDNPGSSEASRKEDLEVCFTTTYVPLLTCLCYVLANAFHNRISQSALVL